MIPRERHLAAVLRLLRQFPIVAILGARQVGKTTLALEILKRTKPSGERFDLEDPADLARPSDAKLALADLKGLVVIDKIQRRPDIFPVLRVLAARRPEFSAESTRKSSLASASSTFFGVGKPLLLERETRRIQFSGWTALPAA